MLGGRISNHDEDEVEDELEAMEREMSGIADAEAFPVVPKKELPPKERAEARRKEYERTAMLA